MEQREVDNMLLSMIQKHFPSLPLSDEHTDWGKWLGFARAVYEAGRASPASVLEGWKHSCNALTVGNQLQPRQYQRIGRMRNQRLNSSVRLKYGSLSFQANSRRKNLCTSCHPFGSE